MIKCSNTRCSEYKDGFCPLWSDCPVFKVEQKQTVSARIRQKKAEKALKPSEDEIQQVVVDYCELLQIPCVHIPNEGKRSLAYAQKLKRMGLQKGFPDLFIPKARKGFHGLFIELKTDKTSRPSNEQKQWIFNLNTDGYSAHVCYGAEEAIEKIKEYMAIR